MEHTEMAADFAQRTLENLDFVQKQVRLGDAGVYEVTQLWNSLLGLVVLPHEHVVKRLPTTPVTEISPEGWPLLTESGREPRSLRELVRRVRNAVAHFNVEFNSGSDRQIRSVTIWNEKLDKNRRPIPGSRGWVGQITVELERLARLIANTYIEKKSASTAA